ncbi:MAG: NAD(P)-dependent oxidoreductase [Devosia nanyangense]|uniref:NAD(P)-dependent oxidoreductase n=1 Tax=Devosia nanyangense TaxID=1228055 RepID=A0A933L5D1_9HYPH|nr:NAD(P)-dependent oxidoreductase [Devosia nanyangense]
MKVAVTGGTGSWDRGVGPVVIAALREAGHEVTNLDWAVPGGIAGRGFIKVDLTDYGQTFAALYGHDAVIQLAANGEPDWDHVSGAARFHTNTLIAYNVFQAACFLGMKKVVWASSETVLGFPFDIVKPKLLPISDDDPPIPTSSYGISKAVTEDLARHMNRRYGVPFIGLRFSNIFYDTPGHVTGYDKVPSFWDDPISRSFNLWGYVDSRDIAQACTRALVADVHGAEAMTIAAPDTIMTQTNAELVAQCFPGCALRPGIGAHESLISIDKAKRLIGYDPQWTWRRVLGRND